MEHLTQLSDDELLGRLGSLVATQRRQLARLLTFLGEVEDRRLHLLRGYSSLFDFCTTALHFSEGEAFRRIAAARLARRFPVVLGHVARGDLHLTGLVLLRDHLTADNHVELLRAAAHKSKRDVELLIAERFPCGDVKGSVRKLPAPRGKMASAAATATPASPDALPISVATPGPASARTFEEDSTRSPRPMSAPAASTAPPQANNEAAAPPCGEADPCRELAASHPLPRPAPARVEPLSPARYRVQLTASQELKSKLDRARELLAHSCPHGDLAVILERALDALLAELERSRRAKTKRRRDATPSALNARCPSPGAATTPDAATTPNAATTPDAATTPNASTPSTATTPPTSRRPAPRRARSKTTDPGAISRPTRRAVFARDGERCTFIGPDGHRCGSRTFLELDHVQPRALGGPNTPENLRVLCRAHNRLAAERTFGREHVGRHLRQRK